MPRARRRTKLRRAGLDEMDIKHLLNGPHGVPCQMTTADHQGDDDAMREAWETIRGSILPKWISAHPGRRPWGWWRFDAPARRERIDDRLHPFDDTNRTLHVASRPTGFLATKAYRLHWGLPGCFIPPFDLDCIRDYMANGTENTKIFEPEWSYLQRHNLLMPEDSP